MSELLNILIQDARIWQGHRQTWKTRSSEPTGYSLLDSPSGCGGWPKGALTECLLDSPGIGELHLLLPLMQRLTTSGKTIFWLNPPYIPYAPALARENVNLNQVVVLHTRNQGDFLWSLENCLRSSVTGLVIAWPDKLASRDIRRLQLAAEAGNNVCVLFREHHHAKQSSPAALRLALKPDSQQGLTVSVLKRRGSWSGQRCTLTFAQRAGLPVGEALSVVRGSRPAEAG